MASALPVAKTTITTAALVAATATAPEHCQVDGEINRRTGIDGQSYAIRFRLRMPTATWNGRFFMGGGGGTDGTLVDPTAQLALGYATIGTDSGHDNTINNVATAGGSSSFGVDYQARVDFAYNSYDQVTQVGKALVNKFYQQPASHSYFVGCSEGGREAMLMTQRFPDYYDGVVAGDPVLHIPLGPLSGLYTTKLFAGLAQRSGLVLANGDPAIGKTYSDPDLLLVRNAVLGACDALDGLADGIVDNQPACTPAVVNPALAAIQCTGAKTATCLSADQIGTLKTGVRRCGQFAGHPAVFRLAMGRRHQRPERFNLQPELALVVARVGHVGHQQRNQALVRHGRSDHLHHAASAAADERRLAFVLVELQLRHRADQALHDDANLSSVDRQHDVHGCARPVPFQGPGRKDDDLPRRQRFVGFDQGHLALVRRA